MGKVYAPPPDSEEEITARENATKVNTLAVVSLVMGLLSLFCGITAPIGLICGIIALKKTTNGRGQAIAGIILSGISLLTFAIAITLKLSGKID